ncbi:MAG: TlpA family protein disulfide reductase [Deltaproteobacteria bacterium]|nr:MAG: TlpA family protein disulfide reductase [Deltaproteobacteria bacterium]
MDRLSTLIAVATLAACGKSDPGELPPRTNGAKVNAPQAASTEAFCDVHADDARGAAFRWPTLAGGPAPGAAAGWRWVNLWATWCKPCIEEMPRLVAWRDKLTAAGKRVELTFVSVDDSDADVAGFRRDHPQAPPSLRVASSEQRTAWLRSLGVSDGAIPIHLFVSPANRLRCARGGEIREQDRGVVDRLLAE